MKPTAYTRRGRLFAALTAAAMSIMLPIQPLSPQAASDTRLVNNIVLFAQFGETENFMDADRTAQLTESLTRTDTVSSLYGYINAISCGQMQTACYFPQLAGGTVQPYTLTQPLETYTRESLALEVIRSVSIPADIPLDGDGDGVIDNFILVIDGEAASQQDTLWQHMSSLAYADVTIGGKRADTYNLLCSGNLFGSVVNPIDIGIVCHEFLHSVGYPDLYRGSGAAEGTPVGVMWDIMAGSMRSNLVSPLAYLRASRSGWLEAEEITADGTYTLAPASAESGSRLYLLRTPASATEFFAVEYRKQGASLRDLDGICSSGLLVYRVNTNAVGNRGTETDEIYLFRPENGDATGQANYGGTGRDDFVGSLNPDDGIAEGALTYSNGVNSGIRIEHIAMAGDTLTFDVQFAEIDRQNGWQTVPNDAAFDSFGGLCLAASAGGTVYLAGTMQNSKAIGLYALSETGCTRISALTAAGGAYEPRLTVAGETPYLLYRDADYRAVLCAYDAAAAAWQTLWQSDSLAQYADLAADGERVYICYSEGDYPAYTLRVLCYADGKTTAIGGAVSGSACDPSLVCTDAAPAVAYRDTAGRNKPMLAVWSADGWTQHTLSEAPCSSIRAAATGKAITVAAAGETAGWYQYAQGAFTELPAPALQGMPYAVQPLEIGGALTAAICTQNDYHYAFYRYDGEWSRLGTALETQYIGEPCAAAGGNVLYTAYRLGETVVIKALQTGAVRGDVNADGSFDIADAVLLQKWLLTMPDAGLANWKAADFTDDNALDASDLCLMKRALM